VRACLTAALAERPLTDASSELLEATLLELQECRKERATSRRFAESAKYHRAIAHVSATHLAKSKEELQKATMEQHRAVARDLEQEARAYDQETQELLCALAAEQAERKARMLDAHTAEKHELNRKWDSIRRARSYNRPSNRVTLMRRQQTLLAVQCRFDEADQVAKMIDEGVRQDEREHAKVRQRDYEESVTKLKAKHAGELAFFDEQCAVETAQLKQRREVLRKGIDNKTKKVEVREEVIRDADRLWNERQTQRQAQITAGTARTKTLPSATIPREEVARLEGGFLALPNSNWRATVRRGGRGGESATISLSCFCKDDGTTLITTTN
jgi:hypothetical protein